jgi:hypothetical protein
MTQKLSVVYKAPPGDSKVTEAYGHTFFDGQSIDVEVDDRTAEKIKHNPVFGPAGKSAADHKAEAEPHSKTK